MAGDRAEQLAQRALTKIEGHEKLCTERYGEIVRRQTEGSSERQAMHDQNQASLRRIYGLIWKLVIGVAGTVIVLLLGAVGSLLWYVITS